MMPAFTSSSLKAPISFKSFPSPGLISASDSLVAFTMTITRMLVSLSGWPAPSPTHSYDERTHTESTPCDDAWLGAE